MPKGWGAWGFGVWKVTRGVQGLCAEVLLSSGCEVYPNPLSHEAGETERFESFRQPKTPPPPQRHIVSKWKGGGVGWRYFPPSLPPPPFPPPKKHKEDQTEDPAALHLHHSCEAHRAHSHPPLPPWPPQVPPSHRRSARLLSRSSGESTSCATARRTMPGGQSAEREAAASELIGGSAHALRVRPFPKP